MVEKTKEKDMKELTIDFVIYASEITDITLNSKESKKLIASLKQGPNEKAKKFSRESLQFYKNILDKSEILK